jgi:DNA uptake protein ComE-like DNA-binding protein
MKTALPSRWFVPAARRQAGSVLVIVLWISIGLVAITLYFANSMNFEMRASANRTSSVAADQAIEGAVRYLLAVLSTFGTNGTVPDVSSYQCEAVPVGDSRFWLIGRNPDFELQSDHVYYGLVPENSKLNLNTVTLERLQLLTNLSQNLELAANIVDWRDTNGNTSANGDGPTVYAQFQPPYFCKNGPYETVEELRLVYPNDLMTLFGEDSNLNGILDPSEQDTNRNNLLDPGLFEYFTLYSKEPNTAPDGSTKVNIRTVNPSSSQLVSLLQSNLMSTRYSQVATAVGLVAAGGGGRGPGQPPAPPQNRTYTSPLQFYMQSGMTADEFALVADYLSVSSENTIEGRVNVNTASPAVLCTLPGISSDLAQQLILYRLQNQDKLTSIAWVVDALGQNNNSALASLAAGDYITTRTYQFSADIVALGPSGRGYRRVRYILDTSSGTPKVAFRRDLTHLGWALGKYTRQSLFTQDTR